MINSNTLNEIDELKRIFKNDYDKYDTVISYILNRLFQKEKVLYSELLYALHGAFPADIFNYISEAQYKKIKFDNIDSSVNEWNSIKTKFKLPPEHLANYEWRYSRNSAKKIISFLNLKDDICCLGTPSIILELIYEKTDCKNLTLLDINAPVINMFKNGLTNNRNINFQIYNVLNNLNYNCKNSFDTVLINPPWYLDYYKLFINRSIQLLKNGCGTIIMPIFPILSRHGAIKDLSEFKKYIVDLGCDNIKSLGYVDFDMPLFEKNFFKANKIAIPNSNWRIAELLELSFSKIRFEKLADVRITDFIEWERVYNTKTGELLYINKTCLNSSNVGDCFIKGRLKSLSRKDVSKKTIATWNENNDVFYKICKPK